MQQALIKLDETPLGSSHDNTIVVQDIGERLDEAAAQVKAVELCGKWLRGTLDKIEATLRAINAADDERNPPEAGVTAAAIKGIRNGRLYLIPASTETRGHVTTGNAALYAEQQELLQSAPQRTM